MGALAFAGLVYDVAGVALLGRALFTPDEILFQQAATMLNGNEAHFRALRTQRFDAYFGVGFLIFGFVLQAVATAGDSTPWCYPLLWVLAGLVPLLGWWLLARKRQGGRSDQVYEELERVRRGE